MARLFDISLEEEQVVVEPVDTTEVIEDVQEQVALEEEVLQDLEKQEEGEEAVAILENQATQNEEVVENAPESVTEDMVQASNECMAFCFGKLGVDLPKLTSIKYSQESASNPTQKLSISTESIKDVIKSIIERLKLFFKQILVKIKQLYSKVMAHFNRLEKRSEAIMQQWQALGGKNLVVGESSLNYINGKLAAWKALDGKINFKSIVQQIDPKTVYNAFYGSVGEVTSEVAKTGIKDKVVEKVKKLFSMASKFTSVNTSASSKYISTDEDLETGMVVRVFNDGIGCVGATPGGEPIYKRIDIPASDLSVDASSVAVESIDGQLFGNIKKLGQQLKSLKDHLNKDHSATLDKISNSVKDDIDDPEKAKAARLAASYSKLISTRVYTECVLNATSNASYVLTAVEKIIINSKSK